MLSRITQRRLRQIGEGVVHGFAQMGSLGESKLQMPTPARSVNDALRSDWARVGKDMRTTIKKAGKLEKAE